MEAVIFMGIQGAGKTTFYRKRFSETHLWLSLDMLRTRHRERVLLDACLAARQRFVIDNTNVTVSERARYITAAKTAGFRVIGYYFQSDLQDALRHNSLRTGRALVPAKGVVGTYRRLQPPDPAEGFDVLYLVRLTPAHEYVVTEWPGPPAS